jgi:hypothetical protein
VVQLKGTNVQEAQKILNSSKLLINSAVDLEDAAKKAVASMAKKGHFILVPMTRNGSLITVKKW